MPKKTYTSLTGIIYTFPVKVDEKICWVSLSGDQLDYKTTNKKIQDEIENHRYFKDGLIGIFTDDKKESGINQSVDQREFPEVTDLNDAVSTLKSEYKVHYSKLKSKEAVLAIAKELGVVFPNLPTD